MGADDRAAPPAPRRHDERRLERGFERFLFSSRWLLAPFYAALVVALVVLLAKMLQELWHFVAHAWVASETDVILGTLTLIDLSLTGSLIVIVIFSGYENFVSKIDETQHRDWPDWMGKIDFTGLKLKLLSSIVAISAIHLLKAFMDVGKTSDRDLAWYVGIHMTFVVSGIILAITDRISAAGHADHAPPAADKGAAGTL